MLRYGWLLPLGAIAAGVTILGLTYAFARIPLPEDIQLTSSAEVYDVNGDLIGVYSDEITRFIIETEPLLKKKPFIGEAVIAAEDRSFYEHNGVSIRGIARAALANFTGGEVQQGGSTITQQYVKNAVLQDSSRTIARKAKEAVLAIKLERRFDKDEILGFYLNTIYLGRGAYGIEAAADAYFDKDAGELNLGEAAYLAGIIPSPEAYQPDTDQQAARARRDRVLDLMAAEGSVDEAKAAKFKSKKVKLAPSALEAGREKRQQAAYFMEWLRKDFLEPEFEELLYTGGLKIYTTLDLGMQAAAENAVANILTEPEDPQAALVSMTPRGEVRALVGGKDFTATKKARGFNYATSPPGRQPGSAFKTFTLLTAFEEGVSPRSTFSGASPQFISENPACNNEDGTPWEVSNFANSSFGSLDLMSATTSSVNTIYAQLIAELGPEQVAGLLAKFDFKPKFGAKEISADCSNSLGGSLDVTPLEMARAYAGLAGSGALPEILPISYVTNSQGDCIKEYMPRKGDCEEEEKNAPEQIVDENSADLVTQALETVVTSGTATAANIGRPVAGKTGTTQDFGNAWFAGYTPQLATVVWEGYPFEPGPDKKVGTPDDVVPEMRFCEDPILCRPVQGFEVTGGGSPVSPAVIWADYMEVAVADMEIVDFPVPTELPTEIVNQAPPAPTFTADPSPTASKEPKPTPTEIEEEPSPEPTKEPSPEPTDSGIIPGQSPEPSPSGDGEGNGKGRKKPDDEDDP
jgi:penicillin-binding protein 1A